MSDFSTLIPRNVRNILPRNDWCQRISIQSGDLWRKLDLKKLISPKPLHCITEQLGLVVNRSRSSIDLYICIKNLGRSKRVSHQLWKPCAQRQAHTTSFRLSWCHMPRVAPLPEQHCHRGVVLFETWADWDLPKKRFSACHCDGHMSWNAMSPNDCTARRCAARPRLHGTTLGTNYPQCFYICTNGCCIVLFATMKCLCPYHFRQLWELRSDFDTILSQKIYKPILHQKA